MMIVIRILDAAVFSFGPNLRFVIPSFSSFRTTMSGLEDQFMDMLVGLALTW
jgi:hypothetical protein